MPKIQLKLMAGLASLVVLSGLCFGSLAERGIEKRALENLDRALLERARLVRELVTGIALEPAQTRVLSERARRAASAAHARVTLIAADGRVIADSDVRPEDLSQVDNHGRRPEVLQALSEGIGRSARTSRTVGRPLIYFALPLRDHAGIVRLAVDRPDIEAALGSLRKELFLAGAIGLLAALVLSFVFSWLTVRPLREMREVLRAIAQGDLSRRLRWHARDERREIADAVNDMAEELRARIHDLIAEKEQLRAVLHGMVEGVLVIGPDGRVILANPSLRRMLGIWQAVQGDRPLEVVREARLEQIIRSTVQDDAPVHGELRSMGPEQRSLTVYAVRFKVQARYGGTILVFHDITQIRQLETMRQDFVANASHELKTPVTAIRGFAETLLSLDLGAQEQQNYLEIIHQNAERLAGLIEDLLELSRIEGSHESLHITRIDLVPTLRSVVQELEPMFEERNIDTKFERLTSAWACADRRAVEQIVRNLLLNAWQYTDPGGQVRLQVTERDGLLHVAVSDNGLGIPQEAQGRIFERFYRVDPARSRLLGGTGLGLAIVKHLVQSMGGTIRVESAPEHGSTFTFTLPTTVGSENGDQPNRPVI